MSQGAWEHACDCAIHDCSVNGMHVATHGHLSLHACIVVHAKGYGLWAADLPVAKLSKTAMRACEFGPFRVATGARMAMSGACSII